ncbi:protein let-756 isoform X2 [Daktulosphaira vitifoliae]|uniref:protein let-756 isoform X2 n=1 Tax=Daktulosphaira vitifoliae TaxID=58002 RepID=UPI0021A9AD30|nr:protein let-756 isoform X2 [Daktulosphaira vitifoliae]
MNFQIILVIILLKSIQLASHFPGLQMYCVILQRASVNTGQLKIQGVATCMYLCMDACGLLYGSKDFDEECVFNEMIEQNHYNTYSSAKYTNDRRTLYLALNKRGTPRKVHVKANAPLGKLSTYTRVLTQPVPVQRVDELLASRRPVGDWPIHGLRHHHVCPPHVGPPLTKHKNKQRKCGNSKFNGRRKKDEMIGGSKGNREDEDCKKNRCDDVSHRKVDTSGRKKNLGTSAKKSGTTAKSKGKAKKTEPEPVMPPEPVVVPVAVVTTVVPSQLDDDDVDADAPATAPSDEFLESNEN